MSTVPVIEVSGVIRLGQFLKLAGFVEDRAMACILIQGDDVFVNGVVKAHRGRQLSHDNMIEVDSPTRRAGARTHITD